MVVLSYLLKHKTSFLTSRTKLHLLLETSIHAANICWSWRRLQDVSWRRLQKVFSVTFFVFQDVLKTSWRILKTSWKTSWRRLEDILKTSWKTKNCYSEDVLKTSSRHVFKTSWRHVFKAFSRSLLGMFYWKYLLLKNLKSVSDKYLSHISECKMH